MNNYLGPTVDSFQYVGCSGVRSPGIMEQITALNTGLNLALRTAGGNDLCLVSCVGSSAESSQTYVLL